MDDVAKLQIVRLDLKTGFLSGLFGEAVDLVPDLDQVAGLSAERDALWARIGQADFLSDDEKREAVGYAPRGGDSD